MFGPKLRVFRPSCGDDYECQPSFGRQLLLALVQGSAPLLVGYALSKIDPSCVEVAVEESDDE